MTSHKELNLVVYLEKSEHFSTLAKTLKFEEKDALWKNMYKLRYILLLGLWTLKIDLSSELVYDAVY